MTQINKYTIILIKNLNTLVLTLLYIIIMKTIIIIIIIITVQLIILTIVWETKMHMLSHIIKKFKCVITINNIIIDIIIIIYLTYHNKYTSI